MPPVAPLPLDHLEVRVVALPRRGVFRSAIGTRTVKHALLVRWWTPDGAWGVGEAACRADPFYSGEFVDAAVLMLRDHLAPLLSTAGTLSDLAAAVGRIRGWPFATGAVVAAALDLRRRQGHPDPIDRWPAPRLEAIPAGSSLGLFDSPAETCAAVEAAAARGFRRIKLKVSPTMHPGTLPAVRRAFPGLALSVDANGSFSAADIPTLARLSDLNLTMLEQPFPPGRLDLDRALKRASPGLPLCLDESLPDLGALRTAHLLGVLDVANLKPGRLGGPLACDAALRWCREQGVPAWIGGMFETGIGRHANLRAASCLPDAPAHDVRVPGEYLAEDVLEEPLVMRPDGTIPLSDAPPAIRWSLIEAHTTRSLSLHPGQP